MLQERIGLTIMEALSSPRLELIPLDGALEQAAGLPPGTTVTVTSSPARGIEPTLALVESLAASGLNAVPHLAARLVRDDRHLDEILQRLIDAAVHDIYVIGGDSPEPIGSFTDAESLLRAINQRGNGFSEIGIAGYPEGHPGVAPAQLNQVLLTKQGLATYLVTQICFDVSEIVEWIRQIRQLGVDLPVYIGIPGVARRADLLRICRRIGVGASARFLTRHGGLLRHYLRPGPFTPDDLLEELAPAMLDPSLDIRGFHIFTFNQLEETRRWLQSGITTHSSRT